MDSIKNANNTLGADPTSLNGLRRQSGKSAQKALPEAARQFEALMLEQVLKSGRAAGFGQGVMESENTKLMNSMLDQQYAQILAKRGVGLAQTLEKSLTPPVNKSKEIK